MFSQLTKSVIFIPLLALLCACSGDALPEAQLTPATAAAPAQFSHYTGASLAHAAGAAAAPAATAAAITLPAVLQPQIRVSESERVAEELRLVDYEQKFSIEMNRRAQEQAEREQRASVSARAGVIQGPGCEGTEGHAALECERSII